TLWRYLLLLLLRRREACREDSDLPAKRILPLMFAHHSQFPMNSVTPQWRPVGVDIVVKVSHGGVQCSSRRSESPFLPSARLGLSVFPTRPARFGRGFSLAFALKRP